MMKKQNRRWFITSAAVASIGLAGCMGDEEGTDPEDDGGDGSAGDDAGDGGDGDDGNGAQDGGDSSDGTGETIDATTLIEAHEEALRAFGSFEGESALDLTEDGAYEAGYEYSLAYAFESGVGLETVTVYDGEERVVVTGEQYTDADGTTHRNLDGDDPSDATEAVDPTQFLTLDHGLAWDAFDPREEDVEFEASGTTTYEGEEVTTYAATGDAPDRVEEVDATLHVNDAGVIVSATIGVTYANDGSELTAESEHAIVSVGQGAPDEPDWVSEDA